MRPSGSFIQMKVPSQVWGPSTSITRSRRRWYLSRCLAERRLKLAGSVGLTVESADLYEAPVVALEGARVKPGSGEDVRVRAR